MPPGMCRCSHLLDFNLNSHSFEQGLHTWWTIKLKHEKQTGTEIPDSVFVATLLNKTSVPLQQVDTSWSACFGEVGSLSVNAGTCCIALTLESTVSALEHSFPSILKAGSSATMKK